MGGSAIRLSERTLRKLDVRWPTKTAGDEMTAAGGGAGPEQPTWGWLGDITRNWGCSGRRRSWLDGRSVGTFRAHQPQALRCAAGGIGTIEPARCFSTGTAHWVVHSFPCPSDEVAGEAHGCHISEVGRHGDQRQHRKHNDGRRDAPPPLADAAHLVLNVLLCSTRYRRGQCHHGVGRKRGAARRSAAQRRGSLAERQQGGQRGTAGPRHKRSRAGTSAGPGPHTSMQTPTTHTPLAPACLLCAGR